MRIVFLGTSSLDDPSPRGRFLPVARELVQAGHSVHLLLLHSTFDAVQPKAFTCDGVSVEYVSQMHVYGQPGQRRYYDFPRLLTVSGRASAALA